MRTIIAGGRDYEMTPSDWCYLHNLEITEVVSGGATGADAGGENYAREHRIPVIVFPADWKQYGRKAGPIRNQQMANYAQAVVLFPGGKGTDSMAGIAKAAGLIIHDLRE